MIPVQIWAELLIIFYIKMKIIKAYKLRIYPTGRQRQVIDKWFRVSRNTFNFCLSLRNTEFNVYKTNLLLLGLKNNWIKPNEKYSKPENIYDLLLLFEALGFSARKYKDGIEKANAYEFSHIKFGSLELKPSIEGVLKIEKPDSTPKYMGVKIDKAVKFINDDFELFKEIAINKLFKLISRQKFSNLVQQKYAITPKSPKNLYYRFQSIKNYPNFNWLTDAPSYVLREAKGDVDSAFDRFFSKTANHPIFKSCRKSLPKCRMASICGLMVESNRIKVQGATKFFGKGHEWIKLSRTNYIPIGPHIKYSQVALSRKGSHWYLSLQLHEEIVGPKERNGKTLGLDIGGRTFISDSNNKTYGNEFYKKACEKLAELERRKILLNRRRDRRFGTVEKETIVKNGIELHNRGSIKLDGNNKAIRQKPSNSWKKIVKQIQNIDRQIGSIMNDLRHQTSNRIIKQGYSEYNVENLKIKDLMRKTPGGTSFNKRMRKMWKKLGAYTFKEQLIYKAKWNNASVNEVEPHYTSQQCSNCGELNRKLGSKEIFKCNSCGYGLTNQDEEVKIGYLPDNHRDCNAARNIQDYKRFQSIRENAWKEKILRAGDDKKSESKEFDNNSGSASA